MFRLNTVLNTGPKIWNNVPKHTMLKNIRSVLEKNCILTYEYPSCTFGVENWLFTFHMVKTNLNVI